MYVSDSNSTVAAGEALQPSRAQSDKPIRVAPKPKKRQKRAQNVFLDDRGFPDESDEFDYLTHSVDGGPILRKLKYPAPDINGDVDPDFLSVLDPDRHEATLRSSLDLSHLPLSTQERVYALVREFWSVCFYTKGYSVPVKNYECVIDTGSARPIAIKGIHYGENKAKYMST